MRTPKKIPKPVKNLLHFLAEKKNSISRLLILTHDNPDPDALASAFALRTLAKNGFGIPSKIMYGGVVGRMENRTMMDLLKIPAHPLKVSYFKKYRFVALVDTQPAFENNSFPKDQRATLVIDQHRSMEKPNADLALIDPKCGATCVILADALMACGLEIPERLATAIAYGILSETQDLHRGTTGRVIRTYLRVLPRTDMRAMARMQNPLQSRNFFMTVSKGIDHAKIYQHLIVSHLGKVENADLVAQIADFLTTYRGIHWALCTGRFEGKLHFSLRTNRLKAEAAHILRYVLKQSGRAGGHGTIAGGSLEIGESAPEKKWRLIENAFSRRLLQRLRFPKEARFKYAFRRFR